MRLILAVGILYSLLIAQWSVASLNLDISDYDAYAGVRLAMGDNMLVLAQNDRMLFSFSFSPYNSSDAVCQAEYLVVGSNTDFQFLHGVAVGRHQTSLQFVFYGLASIDDVPLVGIAQTNTMNCYLLYPDTQRFNHGLQERFILAVDPLGLFAYGATDDFVFAYDLQTFAIQEYNWYDLISNSINPPTVFPYMVLPMAIDVSSDGIYTQGLVLAYFDEFFFYPTAILFQIQGLNMSITTCLRLSSSPLPLSVKQYAREYSMAVALNSQYEALIGITKSSTTMSVSTAGNALTIINSQTMPLSGFGKSVMWLDNSSSIGILALSQSTPPWSQSRLYVYDRMSWMANSNITLSIIPTFALPNNHQEIRSSHPWIQVRAGGFPLSNVVLLSDVGSVWILPPSEPGKWSGPSDNLVTNGYSVFLSNSSCSSGFFKNTSSVGPCLLCPAKTRQISANSVTCVPCNASLFCPPGAIEQIDLNSTVPEYSQSFAYPASPDNSVFNDILLQRMFAMDSSSNHCLLMSPLFWTLAMGVVVLLIIVVMGVLKLFPQWKASRRSAIRFFRHTDLVGEGELWIGGVVSFCVIVQLLFAYWFSIVFLPQYPIESTMHNGFGCDTTLRNAKFSTNLRSVSIPPSGEEQPVFAMLDAQPFTVHMDFVNTQFGCDEITVQQNFDAYSVPLAIANCTIQFSVLSIDFQLEDTHFGQYQVNLTGRRSVGGLRVCLRGPHLNHTDGMFQVQQLDSCRFFSTEGQTMAINTALDLQLTRTINKTAPLSASGSSKFSGIWTLFFVPRSLSDQLMFTKQGSYLRYLFIRHTFVLTLSETAFLIQNNQEPIARQAEVIFNAVLFMMGCLEIFAIIFLVFRLFFWPILRFMRRRMKETCCPSKVVPIIESDANSSDDDDEHEKQKEQKKDTGTFVIQRKSLDKADNI